MKKIAIILLCTLLFSCGEKCDLIPENYWQCTVNLSRFNSEYDFTVIAYSQNGANLKALNLIPDGINDEFVKVSCEKKGQVPC
jgi:hypothetical protein